MFVTKDIIGMDYKTNEALFLLFASYLVILLDDFTVSSPL
ncbi:hypothetical protein HMPREF0027_0279 [Actinobacillus ureae ATCC 25976]|uniref:Uncharacterized protein n=1 Tax=Actinobacillus ureae ATCC 25976 TaxID=887324 RepID=E8KEL2_9PAST|nr:hypothetical protein HMPREF0027_0279 [Actinobacillus ureae ATCC 25976]